MVKNQLKMEVLLSEEKSFSLARKASMHPTTFSAIVNQHYEATEKQKVAIAQALNKPVSKLFNEGARA
jgi:hypothetical protein